jgi:hypothetical protein
LGKNHRQPVADKHPSRALSPSRGEEAIAVTFAPIAHTTMRAKQPDVLGLNLKRSEIVCPLRARDASGKSPQRKKYLIVSPRRVPAAELVCPLAYLQIRRGDVK